MANVTATAPETTIYSNPFDDPRFDRSLEEEASSIAAMLAAHSAAMGGKLAMELFYPPQTKE